MADPDEQNPAPGHSSNATALAILEALARFRATVNDVNARLDRTLQRHDKTPTSAGSKPDRRR